MTTQQPAEATIPFPGQRQPTTTPTPTPTAVGVFVGQRAQLLPRRDLDARGCVRCTNRQQV
jgi:hypothetical protein